MQFALPLRIAATTMMLLALVTSIAAGINQSHATTQPSSPNATPIPSETIMRRIRPANSWMIELASYVGTNTWDTYEYPSLSGTNPEQVIWYFHTVDLGPFSISEQAGIGGNPQQPQWVAFYVQRSLKLPGFPSLTWQ